MSLPRDNINFQHGIKLMGAIWRKKTPKVEFQGAADQTTCEGRVQN